MLELRNISFKSGDRYVLEDVNQVFITGYTYVITGITGGGKSLLMKILGGITKPTEGLVMLNGKSLYTSSRDQCLKNKIGFVFQNGVFLSNLSIIDNLFLPVHYLCPHFDKRDVNETIEKLFNDLNISMDILSKRPSDVSYSDKKIINFIRAFLIDPDYYLINSPLFNLDFGNINKITTFIRQIKEEGKTIIMTTNSRKLIDRFADHVILLNRGKISFIIPASQFLTTQDPNITEYISQHIG